MGSIRLKAKGTAHNNYILVNKVVSYRHGVNNSKIAIYIYIRINN